jgi:hypothetical protein
LSAHNRQFPTPSSQNLVLEQQVLIFAADRLTHQLLGRLKSTIPNPQIYLQKKRQILRSWGWRLTIHALDSLFEFADKPVLGEG